MKKSTQITLLAVTVSLALPLVGIAAASAPTKKNTTPVTFASLDRDGDGTVTNAEYLAAMEDRVTPRTAKSRFNALDKDRDGTVSLEEFNAAEAAKKQPKKKKATE